MTAQRTYVTNAAETRLDGPLTAGSTTISVVDTSALPAVPFYAVIDPGDDAKREVVLIDGSKSSNTLTLSSATSRGEDGTADVSHDAGAILAVVPVAALWTDVHDRIDQVSGVASTASGDLAAHASASNPHAESASTTALNEHAGNPVAHAQFGHLRRQNAQAIASGVTAKVTFTATEGPLADPTNSRISIPANGVYAVSYYVERLGTAGESLVPRVRAGGSGNDWLGHAGFGRKQADTIVAYLFASSSYLELFVENEHPQTAASVNECGLTVVRLG